MLHIPRHNGACFVDCQCSELNLCFVICVAYKGWNAEQISLSTWEEAFAPLFWNSYQFMFAQCIYSNFFSKPGDDYPITLRFYLSSFSLLPFVCLVSFHSAFRIFLYFVIYSFNLFFCPYDWCWFLILCFWSYTIGSIKSNLWTLQKGMKNMFIYIYILRSKPSSIIWESSF